MARALIAKSRLIAGMAILMEETMNGVRKEARTAIRSAARLTVSLPVAGGAWFGAMVSGITGYLNFPMR